MRYLILIISFFMVNVSFAQKSHKKTVTRSSSTQSEVSILRSKANNEEPISMAKLSLRMINGWGVKYDEYGAKSWLENAYNGLVRLSNQGNLEAKAYLGYYYFLIRQDYQTALRYLYPVAKEGVTFAEWAVGLLYEQGYAVDQNYSVAFAWYKLAADKGFALAENNIGAFYHNGYGVDKDNEKSVEWYRKSAKQENSKAYRNVGAAYANGEGVQQNFTLAKQYITKAANLGDENAIYALQNWATVVRQCTK